MRPNIHIADMINVYLKILESDLNTINGEIFNAGYENKSVIDIANTVKQIVGNDIKIIKKETDDNRSYHISSDKIKKILNFESKFTIEDAIFDIKNAFDQKLLIDPLNNPEYFNIKKMQQSELI